MTIELGRPITAPTYPRWLRMLSWLGLPLYVVQGLMVRRRSLRLPPPPGPIAGKVEGADPAMKLLVLGDSSVQAVGVDQQEKGLAHRLVAAFAELDGRAVIWRAAGFNSATASDLRDHVVPHIEPRDFSDVVICIGTNDSKNFHSGRRFKKEFGTLIYALRARFPAASLYWLPIFDFRRVPALPAALAYLLDIRRDALSLVGQRLCEERGVRVLPALSEQRPEGFSIDGFHASEAGYDYVARHIARSIADLSAPNRAAGG